MSEDECCQIEFSGGRICVIQERDPILRPRWVVTVQVGAGLPQYWTEAPNREDAHAMATRLQRFAQAIAAGVGDTELQRLEMWLLARDPMGANTRTPSETVDTVLQELNRLAAVDGVRVGFQTIIPVVERAVAAFAATLRENPGLVEKIVANAQAAKQARQEGSAPEAEELDAERATL